MGKGYVCHCSMEDIRNRRKIFQEEERDNCTFDETILSPYRNRKAEENPKEFDLMYVGFYNEGDAVFRFKMDLE